MSQRSAICQQLELRIYIIENPVTQACEIFGNLSTIGINEVNPSLTAYICMYSTQVHRLQNQ